MQAKLDAQNEVILAMARHLDIEDEDTAVLVELVGVEDAPERTISDRHAAVRDVARRKASGPSPSARPTTEHERNVSWN